MGAGSNFANSFCLKAMLKTVNQLADIIFYIIFLSELTRRTFYNSRFSFEHVWWVQQLNPGALGVEPTQPTTIPPGWFPPSQDKQVQRRDTNPSKAFL